MSETQLAIPYFRKSTVDAKGIFEEHQRAVGALAKRLGATIDPALTFVEDDVSASKPRAAETEWGKMLAAVERVRPKYVLAQAVDRLGRRLADLEGLSDLSKKFGFSVVTVTENDLFSSPIWPFIAARAKTETLYLSIRVRASQEKMVRNGQPKAPVDRFGYIRTGLNYEIDDATAPHVRQAYADVLGGKSVKSIALGWNALGLRTTRGTLWTRESVSRQLDTGFAAGYIRERSNPPTAKEGGKAAMHHYDIWRKGAHTPIVDEDTWQQYRDLRLSAERLPPRLKAPVHALSGLMHCGLCGKRMTCTYDKKRMSWVCRSYKDTKTHRCVLISNKAATEMVLAWLDSVVESGEDVTAEAERILASRSATTDVESWQTEVARLKAKRLKILDDKASGYMDDDEAVKLLESAKRDLAEALKQLELAKRVEAATADSRLRAFTTLREEWAGFAPEYQNRALAQLVRHFTVVPNEIPYGRAAIVPVEIWAEPSEEGSVTEADDVVDASA